VAGVFRVGVTPVIALARECRRVAFVRALGQGDLFNDGVRFCEESLPQNSIYRFLARERERLFPDEPFADLFAERGAAFGAAVRGGHGDSAAAAGVRSNMDDVQADPLASARPRECLMSK
jgi:hypothetical protein